MALPLLLRVPARGAVASTRRAILLCYRLDKRADVPGQLPFLLAKTFAYPLTRRLTCSGRKGLPFLDLRPFSFRALQMAGPDLISH